jgi:glycerol-3-phosphate dehydrogenase
MLERLRTGTFDLLVIGAGIVGSRVAYDGARAGLRVALVDAGDFGGATSSASSKLIHGGFRYLATGQLRLVRRSQYERAALLRAAGPHLVYELPVVIAVERETSRWRAAVGTRLYTTLGGRRGTGARVVSFDEACALVPPLCADRLATCLLVDEAQTHDSRLTLATVNAAASAGAVVANYIEVVALEKKRGRIVGALLNARGDGPVGIRCRAVVNAAGPWVDAVRALEDSAARPLARLSKGVHVVLPLEPAWTAAVAAWDERKTVLAAPWNGMLLLGATDTPYDGDPRAVGATDADVRDLLAAASRFLPAPLLARDRVRFAFAGLRVLPRATERPRGPRAITSSRWGGAEW